MKNIFAFVFHPVQRDIINRRLGMLQGCPSWALERLLLRLPPLTLAEMKGVRTPYTEAEGFIISSNVLAGLAPRLPEAYLLKKMMAAARKAARLGAGVIGLDGAAGAGDAGISLARAFKSAVTTGSHYAVASTLDGYRGALRLMGADTGDAVVMVHGAGTAAGGICARILAREGVNFLTLTGRDLHRLDGLAQRILTESGVSCKVSSLPAKAAGRADLVIAAGDLEDFPVGPGDFKPGAVVWDLVSRPRPLSAWLTPARKDLLAIEEALIKVPGAVNCPLDMGLPPGTVYPWMAETIILALERRHESYSLGADLRIGKVEEIRRLAGKHGFKVEGYRSAGRCLSGTEINRIRQNAARKKRMRGYT
jgi:predicted amino acid dehydrogenase